MRYIAAYLLYVLGGNERPTAEDVTAILSAGDVDVDPDKLNELIRTMEGKDLEEVMERGHVMLDVALTVKIAEESCDIECEY